MFTKDKRSPAFTDDDKILFGKFQGKSLVDVPANYLSWLKDQLEQDGYHKMTIQDKLSSIEVEKLKLYNYIFNSWEAIKDEMGNKD